MHSEEERREEEKRREERKRKEKDTESILNESLIDSCDSRAVDVYLKLSKNSSMYI